MTLQDGDNPIGRIFIIGLDGGTWSAIEPLLNKGLLPAFRQLMQAGATGTLKSTFPSISCPAWFSFSTGVSPGKLGMYDFWGMPDRTNDVRYHSYNRVPYPDFWDYINEHEMSCGIINDPLVYMKKSIEGYIIPGYIVPQKHFSTFPPYLAKELHNATGGYEIDQQAHYLIDDEILIEGCSRIMDKRWRAFRYLIKEHPTDIFFGVITGVDRIFHRFFVNLESDPTASSTGYEEVLSDFMQKVDRGLGSIMEIVGPQDMLLLMSDHGFEVKEVVFRPNQLLADLGLLYIKKEGPMERIGLTQRDIAIRLSRAGLLDAVKKYSPEAIRRFFPKGRQREEAYLVHELIERDRIDWGMTKMIYIDGFHANTSDRPEGIIGSDEIPRLIEEVALAIKAVFIDSPDQIKPILLRPHEIYPQGIARDAPDLMVDFAGPVRVDSTFKPGRAVLDSHLKPNHSRDGLFLARHPFIKPGRTDPIDILDLAPLLLHCVGLNPGHEMQGRVPESIFVEGSPPFKRYHELFSVMEKTAAEKALIKRMAKKLTDT